MSAHDDTSIKNIDITRAVVPCFPLNLYARRRTRFVTSDTVMEDEDEPQDDLKEEEEAGVLTRAQRLVKKQLDGKKKERDDILFATRRLGVEKLLKEKPLTETQPYRCGKTFLDTRNYEVTMVKQSMHGEKLYKVFEQSLKKSRDKSFSLLFHGTGCKATEDITQNGMDPNLRVSSSGDWFTRDINYALTRAICRVSAVEGCGGSSPAYPTHGIVSSSPANKEKPTNDISPRVHVLAFVVINERCVKIGDHIVCDSEKHSLPVFKLSFPRNVLPPLKAPGEVKKPSCVTSSPASRLASVATKKLYPSTPKK